MRNLKCALGVSFLMAVFTGCPSGGGGDSPKPDGGTVDEDGGQVEIDGGTTVACETLSLSASPATNNESFEGSLEGTSTTTPSTCPFGEGYGPEAVYYVDLDHEADIVWTVVADFDAQSYIRMDCDGLDDDGQPVTDEACTDWEGAGATEIAEWWNAAAGRYFLFVDGYSDADLGAFTATLLIREIVGEGEACGETSRCEDGFGCDVETQTCMGETDCTNLTDDEGDYYVDCEDPTSCQGTADCTAGETETGEACDAPSDCFANADDPVCLSEGVAGYPGGYCAEFCDITGADCSETAVCADFGLSSGNGICMDLCEDDGDCREGYSCESLGYDLACLPKCTDDSQCPSLGFCNSDSGFCSASDESCEGGVDDDLDYLVDCEDKDCASACAETFATACSAVEAATKDTEGDTSDGGSQIFAGSCTGGFYAYEDVYFLHSGSEGDWGIVSISLDSDTDQGFYVRTDCADGNSEIACVESAFGGSTEHTDLLVEGGTALTIFVDGYWSDVEAGPYDLAVEYSGVSGTLEVEPNDSLEEASAFEEGFTGAVSPAGDNDWVLVTVSEGKSSITAEVTDVGDEDCADFRLDSEIELYDSDGTSVGFNDDASDDNYCSLLEVTDLTAGTYYIRVASSTAYAPSGTFVYILEVEVD